MERKHLYLAAIVGSIAFILLAILPWRGFDPGGHWHRVGWIPFASRPVRVVDVLGNLLLFVPLGAAIALHAGRSALLRTAGVAFVCSFAGEWAQVYSRYRYPSGGDLVCNVAGAVMTAWIVNQSRQTFGRAATPTARPASQLSRRTVEVTYKVPAPPALLNGRGRASVD